MNTMSLWDLRKALAQIAADDPSQPPHARAFALWIRREKMELAAPLRQLAEDSARVEGAARLTTHAAVLGYSAHLESTFMEAFSQNLAWLREREYFVAGRPPTFEVDGLALLGIAVGVSRLEDADQASAMAWLNDLLHRSLSSQRKSDWNESLMRAALAVCSKKGDASVEPVFDDLRTALAAKGLMSSNAASRANTWNHISELTGPDDGMVRAATQLAALVYLLREASTLSFGSTSVEDIVRVLEGIARSMRRWAWEERPRSTRSIAARWDIENEYHVQDLLWAILAPIFPDLDDEEWLKSLGVHHPRADLAIPSLELIIEVKFARSASSSELSSLTQEVAADASTYLQEGSGYKYLIAFVWDNAARTEDHAELRQGLMRLRGVKDAIILPRPAKMRVISS